MQSLWFLVCVFLEVWEVCKKKKSSSWPQLHWRPLPLWISAIKCMCNKYQLTNQSNAQRGNPGGITEEAGHDSRLTGVPSSIREGEGSEGESLHCLTWHHPTILEPLVGYGGASEPLSSSDSTGEGVHFSYYWSSSTNINTDSDGWVWRWKMWAVIVQVITNIANTHSPQWPP